MGLTVGRLEEIARHLQQLAPHEDAARLLRERLRELVVLRCDPEDLRGEAAYYRQPPFALHLVDASQHCWRLVDDPARATAILLTRTP